MVAQQEKTTALDAKLVIEEHGVWKINAQDMHYRQLNTILRELDAKGAQNVEINNVYGQRYIGTDLKSKMKLDIYGTPGNDLAAFMDGQTIEVHGNAQDCICNTMNDGKIVIHGRVGDITGYGMRGGKLFIRDDAGYRVGIHMKEYMDNKPIMVVGGTAQDFLGEYMAGGILLVLGLTLGEGERHRSRFGGTGMHSGVLYIRGEVASLGKEVKVLETDQSDLKVISELVHEYASYFNADADKILKGKFNKIVPFSHRPYGRIYAY
jgi:glutamate synthase domain-containing protein 3